MAACREIVDFPSDRDVHDQGYDTSRGPRAAGPEHDADRAETFGQQAGGASKECEHVQPHEPQRRAASDDKVERLVRNNCADPAEIARVVTKASVRPRHILLAVQRCVSHGLTAALVHALDAHMHYDPVLMEAWELACSLGDDEAMRTLELVCY